MKQPRLFTTIAKAWDNFILGVQLLFFAPREFVYSFTYSTKEKISIQKFDPKAKKVATQVVADIEKACPKAKVHFFGSTNLEISGLNDIDLFVTTSIVNFRSTARELRKLFGPPAKNRPLRQEWEFEKNGYPVEVVLVDPSSKMFRMQRTLFTAFQNNPKLVTNYQKLKESLNGLSLRDYHRSRILFFRDILVSQKKRFSLPSIATIFVGLFLIGIFALTVRGIAGNPSAQSLNSTEWKDEGPLELSPDRGRFALTYSLLEDKSFYFSIAVAKFAAPDVAYNAGHFVSLFAPTVSYIIMPGYVIGKMLGASQVGSFAVISFFAFINFFLIRAIAKKVGATSAAATAGALLFVFASPAFAYAVTLYQHHISTFLILMSIYILISKKSTWWYVIIWFLCALSISVDNPNLFLMAPIGLFAVAKVFTFKDNAKTVDLHVRWPGILTMAVMVLPVLFFMYFNKMSYDNPFQLAGTVASGTYVSQLGVDDLSDQLQMDKPEVVEDVPTDTYKKSALAFFRPRQLPHGLYEHFLSLDRGMIIYTPVLLLGVIGAFFLFKKNPQFSAVLVSVIGVNALLYSMWGDPYGGWAFGSRYMIPSYSLFAIFLAYALTVLRRNLLFVLIVFILGSYAIGVNTIGAITSNRNPPQVEILAMEAISGREEKYTFARNMQMLDANRSKSFAYSMDFIRSRFNAWEFAKLIIGSITAVFALSMLAVIFSRSNEESFT